MAEEEQQKEVPETPEESSEELSETEQKAREMGWSPEGPSDPNKRAISAEEFLDRQKLYDDLKKRGKELRQYKEELEALKESHKKIAKQSYDRALQDLKKEKKEAYDEGDTDKIVEVDEKIRQTEQERDREEQTASKQDNSEEMKEAFQNWAKENPWYENDQDLKEVADAIGHKLQAEDPNIVNDPEEFLSKVTEKVKKASPEKFKGQKRQNPVEGEKNSGGGKKKYSIKSLDEDTRRVAKRVMEATGMSEEQYMRDYLGESEKESK